MSEQQEDNQQPLQTKKREWLASRLCVTSKRTQAQHTKPKQTQKTILLNSTISSPIATGPLLRQSAKHTYLQGTENFKICLDLSLRWSSGARTYMLGRKQGSFGADSKHPFTPSQFTACDGLGKPVRVRRLLEIADAPEQRRCFPVTYGIELITRHNLLFRGSRATAYQR